MVINSTNFNLKQIAESGQCFRINKLADNKYSLIAFGKYIELIQVNQNTVEISCSEEDYEQIWKEYFDLEYDYNAIVRTLMLGDDDFLREAAIYGSGLRILRQDPFEALISFIISQNKNIPAIMSSIEKLCRKFGEPKIWKICRNPLTDSGSGDRESVIEFYDFPTPDRLAEAAKEELKETGIGYRDDYIIEAAKAAASGVLDLQRLKKGRPEEAIAGLKSLRGIGDKVANCVSLYGLHHIDACPIDLWIARVLKEVYNNNFDWSRYKGYAGIVQQYMFYYIRSKSAHE